MVSRKDGSGLYDDRRRRVWRRKKTVARHRGGLADFSYGIAHELPAEQIPGSLRGYVALLSDVPADYRPSAMTAGRFHTVSGVVEYIECSERTDVAMWPPIGESMENGYVPMTWVRRRWIDTPTAAMGVGVLGVVFSAIITLVIVAWAVLGVLPGVVATGVGVAVCLIIAANVVVHYRQWAGMVVDDGQWVLIRSADWVDGLAEMEAQWDAGAGPEAMTIGVDRLLATQKVG